MITYSRSDEQMTVSNMMRADKQINAESPSYRLIRVHRRSSGEFKKDGGLLIYHLVIYRLVICFRVFLLRFIGKDLLHFRARVLEARAFGITENNDFLILEDDRSFHACACT